MSKTMGYVLGILNTLIVLLLTTLISIPKSNQHRINSNEIKVAEVKTDLNTLKTETIPRLQGSVDKLTIQYDKLNDKIDKNFRETNKQLQEILIALQKYKGKW